MTDPLPDKVSKTVIIHGTGGSPSENWFPWLKAELEDKGVAVLVPELPEPSNQSLTSWKKAFREQTCALDENTILIGHSIGCGLILRLLEESDTKIKATFLVSAWEGLLDSTEFDPLIYTFFETPFHLKKMKANAGAIYQYHGEDDPYVPLKMATELAGKLGSELSVIRNGGHLNAPAGFTQFQALLDDIDKFLP